jgi:isocitrate lyase
MAPIIADAEAGFGGALNAYELMKAMIEAGAAGVHFEDQLPPKRSVAIWAARFWCRSRNISAP